MNNVDESSDILGGKIMQSPPPPGFWASLPFSLRAFITLSLGLAIYVAAANAWRFVLKKREKSYKLALRRQHGIPDNDHRPFNVAYAAVMRTRRDQEKANSRPAMPTARVSAPGSSSTTQNQAVSQLTNAPDQQQRLGIPTYALPQQLNTSTVRQRQGQATQLRHMDSSWSSTPGLPGRYLSEGVSSSLTGGRPRTVSSNSATLSNPRAASIGHINNDNDRTSTKRLDINGLNSQSEDQPEARGSKRGLDDDLQGDQIGDYYYYDDGDEASGPSKRKRDKRARKISLQKGADGQPVLVGDDHEDEMMVDDDGEADDALGEMRSLARGRKRDRAEAGSTFGGDDDDDSVSEEVEELSAKERRRRKRRTVSKRKSEIGLSLRGRKRDRGDSDNEDSEDYDEESDDAYVSKGKGKHSKKRGKRGSHVHEQLGVGRFGGYGGESGSDVSMDGSGVSSHPSCKGRKIGEEWESHGTHFKVGPNGDRLRRVLIRQERSKFPMPADSEHPDRDAGVEIFVEKWLTDDEYRVTAKTQQLAASITPSSSTEPETPRPEDEEDSQKTFDAPLPPPVGKNLLYEAPGTPSQRRYAAQYRGYSQQNITQDPFRQSVATNVGLRANSRRIAISNTKRVSPGQLLGTPPASPISLSSSMNGSLADSTNTNSGLNNSLVGYRGSPRRTYSKWEKQDMEAAAMRQVREAARRKEKEKEEKEKERKEREAKEKASAAITTPPIVTLTPAPPTPVPSTVAPTPSPSPFSFGKPDEAKDKAASPAPTPAAPKPASSLGFGFPPASSASTDASKPASATPPTISLSSAPPLGTSSVEADKAKAANPTPLFAPPSFSLNTPSAPTPPAPQSTAPASNSIPNFFGKPAAANAPAKSSDSPLKFGFGPTPPAATNPAPASTAPPAAAQPVFSFGAPAAPAATPASSTPSQPPAQSVFGFGSAPAPKPATAEPPKLAFGQPAANSSSVFGGPSTAPSQASQPTPAFGAGAAASTPAADTSAGPKFSFNLNFGKPAAPAPAASTETAKPPAPTPAAFGFGAPKPAAQDSKPDSSSSSAFKFQFNQTQTPSESSKPTPSAFGFPSTSSSTPTAAANPSPFGGNAFGAAASSTPASEAPKSAFAGFGNTANKGSGFGSITPASSPFGAANGTNPFGAQANGSTPSSTSAFGTTTPSATPTTTTAPSQPTFSFGAPAPTVKPLFGQPQAAPTTTPTASPFGAPASSTTTSTTPAAAPTSSAFKFGPSSAAPPPVFGSAAQSNPSPFGGSSTNGGALFSFGAPPKTPSK